MRPASKSIIIITDDGYDNAAISTYVFPTFRRVDIIEPYDIHAPPRPRDRVNIIIHGTQKLQLSDGPLCNLVCMYVLLLLYYLPTLQSSA